MVVGAAVATLGRDLIVTLYGAEYQEAADVLPALVVAAIPWAVTSVYLTEARVRHRSGATVLITVVLSAAILVPALVLVPEDGIDGAATAFLVGNIVAAVVALGTHLQVRTHRRRPDPRHVARRLRARGRRRAHPARLTDAHPMSTSPRRPLRRRRRPRPRRPPRRPRRRRRPVGPVAAAAVAAACPPTPAPPPAAAAGCARRSAASIAVGRCSSSALVGAWSTGSLGDDGPGHPDEWDPRVADLAAFVEDERGLEFDHPVYVDFLTPAEYTARDHRATTTRPSPTTSGPSSTATPGELRALGVASGELDLFEAFNQVSDGGTLAFYDPTDERIRVRGTEMTRRPRGHARPRAHPRAAGPALRPRAPRTTATLDDGAADRLPRRWPRATRSASRTPTSRTSSPTSEQADVRRGVRRGAGRQRGRRPSDVPAVRRAPSSARPTRSASPSSRCSSTGRQRRRRRRLRASRPSTEEHLFDPASFLADEGAERRVELGFDGRRRAARRGALRRHRAGTSSSPSGSTRRSPSRPPSAGTATPSRPYERGRRDLRAGGVRRRHAPTTRTRWPPRSTTWVDAMPGEAAEVDRGRRPPRARGLRPRRGPRPRAHRPLGDVAVPPEPLGLPRGRRRRRCSMPTSRRCYAQHRRRRPRPTRRSSTPRATAFADDGFQDSLDGRLRGLRR